MVGIKVLKAIEQEKNEYLEKSFEEFKIYVNELEDAQIEDDVLNGLINSFLEFKQKKNNATSEKKKTFYTHYVAIQMAKIKEEEKDEKDPAKKTPPRNYMNVIGARWRKYKETSSFLKDKEKWEKENKKNKTEEKKEELVSEEVEPKKKKEKKKSTDTKKENKKTQKKKEIKKEANIIMLESDSESETSD